MAGKEETVDEGPRLVGWYISTKGNSSFNKSAIDQEPCGDAQILLYSGVGASLPAPASAQAEETARCGDN